MQLIDSHCHFDDPRFDPDRDLIYQRAQSAGVVELVVPGITRTWWPRLKRVCIAYPGLHPAYGLHPMFMEHHGPGDIAALADWLTRETAVAIGECGLDFFINGTDRVRQLELFEQQVALAQELELPLIIHARRAVEEVIAVLRRHPGTTGVLHSFSGSHQQALRLMELGFMMSFGGAVTHDRATRLQALAGSLPLEHIMLETDAPDQPDAAIHGQRNEPARLTAVLRTIARLRKESLDEIAAVTTANCRSLFRLELPPEGRKTDTITPPDR